MPGMNFVKVAILILHKMYTEVTNPALNNNFTMPLAIQWFQLPFFSTV